MPRPPRADEASGLYHALIRGNSRATIFHKEEDYTPFERILYEALQIHPVDARIPLTLIVGEARHEIEFILDTGFNGFFAVSPSLVEQLGLKLGAVQSGITADGRSGFFDTVRVSVDWHGQELAVQAQVLDEPLIGTRLVRGNRVEGDWVLILQIGIQLGYSDQQRWWWTFPHLVFSHFPFSILPIAVEPRISKADGAAQRNHRRT